MLQKVMVLVTQIISGCIDSLADNYNPSCKYYDGSCTFDSGSNHIFVQIQLMDLPYAIFSDIIIDYQFISLELLLVTISIGSGEDALIRYSL